MWNVGNLCEVMVMDDSQRPCRLRRATLLAVAFLFSATVTNAQQSKGLSDSELKDITNRGRMLAEYDEAAWHASDAFMALKPDTKNLGRYIARKMDAGWVVVFGQLNDSKDKFLIACEAKQGANSLEYHAERLEPPKEDTAFFLFSAKSIEIALAAFQAEKRPYNVAVLPASSNQMYVYIVPAPTVSGVYPLGGDARVLMSADGGSIIENRRLHKTILEYKAPPKDAKTTIEGGFHVHVLSNVPEDTDVFHVLSRKPSVPEVVATDHFLYTISTDGTIKEQPWKHK